MKTDDFHKNKTTIYFEIVDANSGIYHEDTFKTEAEARKVIKTDYENRSKNDGFDEFWRNRKQIVIKVTTITDVLG